MFLVNLKFDYFMFIHKDKLLLMSKIYLLRISHNSKFICEINIFHFLKI